MRKRASRQSFAALLGLALLVLGSNAPAGGRIFTFTDEAGVTHFTNVPRDQRYRPLDDSDTGRFRMQRVPRQWIYDGLIGLTAR